MKFVRLALLVVTLAGCGEAASPEPRPTRYTIEIVGTPETTFDATCTETRSGRFDCTVVHPRRFRCRNLTSAQTDALDEAGCPPQRRPFRRPAS
jgi:hypothetical protein